MKSEEDRTLRRQVILHILMISRVISAAWHQKSRSEIQFTLDQFRLEILEQVCPTQSSVPVVGYVTAVHDFAEQVAQVLPGHFGIALEIIQQYRRADSQVADVEGI